MITDQDIEQGNDSKFCENTGDSHSGGLIKVKLRKDLGGEWVEWCEECVKRDADCIEEANDDSFTEPEEGGLTADDSIE